MPKQTALPQIKIHLVDNIVKKKLPIHIKTLIELQKKAQKISLTIERVALRNKLLRRTAKKIGQPDVRFLLKPAGEKAEEVQEEEALEVSSFRPEFYRKINTPVKEEMQHWGKMNGKIMELLSKGKNELKETDYRANIHPSVKQVSMLVKLSRQKRIRKVCV